MLFLGALPLLIKLSKKGYKDQESIQSSTHLTQDTNGFSYSCSFTLDISYTNDMLDQREKAVRMLKKQSIIKAH